MHTTVLNYLQVLVNGLQLDEALGACRLYKSVSEQTLDNHVKKASKAMNAATGNTAAAAAPRGESSSMMMKDDMVTIKIPSPRADDDDDSHDGPTISATTEMSPPVTCALSSDSTKPTVLPTATTTEKKKRTRRNSKQMAQARMKEKLDREDYNSRFKEAFREGTLALARDQVDPAARLPCTLDLSVPDIVKTLNEKYCLDGKRKLCKSTLYKAIQEGRVGQSPPRRGPRPKIPNALLHDTALHAEMVRVGGKEFKGQDFKRMLHAAKLGTVLEHNFTAESAWRKLRREFPEVLMSMAETRAKYHVNDA